jgi:hypothetical protein
MILPLAIDAQAGFGEAFLTETANKIKQYREKAPMYE